ncbi:PKD domain-containing protein [Marinifilum sp.]|uniref:PKD domain-containing protein n=1 Tax=Marinifilum sp. TaxID=2033137 RepID=UPI003BA8EB05
MKQIYKYKLKAFFATFLAVLLFAACNEVEDLSITLDTPVADFVVRDTSDIGLNGVITFTNKSVNGAQYFWDFGDGTISEEVEPMHSYTEVGTYTISMIAQNGKNGNYLTHEKTMSIEVTTAPFAYFNVDTLLKANKEVHFINKSARATSYLWDFGDGNTSTDETPDHIYTEGGRYEITLTSSNDDGEEAVWKTYVTVLAPLLEGIFDNGLTLGELGWSVLNYGTATQEWEANSRYQSLYFSAHPGRNPDGVDDWVISPKVTYDGLAPLTFDMIQPTFGRYDHVPVKIWIAKKVPESADDFTIMVKEVIAESEGWDSYELSLKEHVSEGEEFYIGFHIYQTGSPRIQIDNIIII